MRDGLYEEVVKEDNIISYSDREVRDLIRISDFRRTANKIVLPMLIFLDSWDIQKKIYTEL